MELRHINLLEGKKDINIIHITDTHLFKNKDGILKGTATSFEKLQLVICDIKQRDFDAVIVTGDISEDRSAESYQLLKDELDKLEKPSLWLPGNHDNFENMPKEIFEEHVFNTADIGNWKLIFLDTTIQGVDYGNLNTKELNRLDLFLEKNKNFNKLICMHHPPIDVGSEFIDALGLKNKEEFWQVISKHSAPKGILFGHVHQIIHEIKTGILLSSPPSACLQWVPRSKEFACDDTGEGYQIVRFDQTEAVACTPKAIEYKR